MYNYTHYKALCVHFFKLGKFRKELREKHKKTIILVITCSIFCGSAYICIMAFIFSHMP